LNNNIKLSLLACLTLGLTPYYPEPHIVGKLRWIAGGGHGMQAADYFDLIMHGTPWLFLIYFILMKFKNNYNVKKT
jgi:hypothetical protein